MKLKKDEIEKKQSESGIGGKLMRNIAIVFKKQLKDTIKNKTILIQFIMFPLLTVIMEKAISLPDMPAEHFFSKLFMIMYIGMAPIMSVAAIISEEKEKNTLRPLIASNVKSGEYLIGVGSYVWLICMAGAAVMGLAAGFAARDMVFYMVTAAIGFIISILAGSAIGIYSENQMKATSLVLPVMLVFSFLPMLSMFNDKIAKVARFTYTQQLNSALLNMNLSSLKTADFVIIAVNAVLFLSLFCLAFGKKRLE